MRRVIGTSVAAALLILGGSAAPAAADTTGTSSTTDTNSPAGTVGVGRFRTLGDPVHVSKTPPRELSAHGGWKKYSGSGTRAKVKVWIQVHTKKGWKTIARPGGSGQKKNPKIVKSGGGSGKVAVARKRCHKPSKRHSFRSLVDVDILGVGDTPEKLVTKTKRIRCGL